MKRLHLCCIVTIVFVSLTFMSAYAQPEEKDFRSNKHVMVLSGAFSTYGSDPAFGWELSYYRYLLPYVGVTGGIAYQNWGDNIDEPSFTATDRRGFLFTLEDKGKLERLHCIVGLSLRTPSIKISKAEDYSLFLQCDPAMLFTLPNEKFSYSRTYKEDNMALKEWKTAKNHEGKCYFWRVKSSISLGIDNVILSIGYIISNQDPFSGRRNVMFDGRKVSNGISKHHFTHEFYLSAGYSF